MTHRWVIGVEVEEGRVLISGWQGGRIARSIGAWPVWLGGRRQWQIRREQARDFIIAAEERGAAVIVTGELPPPVKPDQPAAAEDPQLALFGIGGVT